MTGELAHQLSVLIDQLGGRCVAIFGGGSVGAILVMPMELRNVVRDAYLQALGSSIGRAELACLEIGTSLVDSADIRGEEFWRTPLGRVISWHIGYPYPMVPAALVGAILGTSRQYGYRAIGSAPLHREDGRHYVPVAAVVRLVRERRERPVP